MIKNMKIEDYKFKKGDVVNFTFTYPEGHTLCGPKNFKGTFKKYTIIDINGFHLKFGPTNIKKAKVDYVMATIEYINEYKVKILFNIYKDDLKTICLA
jgi:hypothetical protein